MTNSSQKPIALEERTASDDRLHSPSSARNTQPIADILGRILPQGGHVLEIGSGTGQHAAGVCEARSDLTWQPSDPDARSRQSQNAWGRTAEGRIRPSIDLDLTVPSWADPIAPADALVCINVIHIAPWEVAEALAGYAGESLPEHGLVFLYGPFKEGDKTAESNLAFDASLRGRNADWGVRHLHDVEALFSAVGLPLADRIDMPANNLSLVFRKRS